MVTLAQRIEELRTAKGLSRPAAAAALGFPKGAFEKFETGRQTPTKDQQEKMATVMDSVLSTKQVQDLLRSIVLDTLRSPEGQELIAKAVHRELLKQK